LWIGPARALGARSAFGFSGVHAMTSTSAAHNNLDLDILSQATTAQVEPRSSKDVTRSTSACER
jgi:hypothetical protein